MRDHPSAEPPGDPAAPAHGVGAVLDRLREAAGRDTVSLRTLVEAGGATSFVPALMIPAILVVSPLSGIPVFSSVCGLTIALIAGQMAFGRGHLWLPRALMNRHLNGPRVRGALDRIAGLGRWIDRHSRDRLRLLTVLPLVKIPQALSMLCGLAMPLLELVPFSSSLLGLAVLFFSVSFLARDGLYVVAGAATMGLAALVPATIVAQVVD